MGQYFYFYNNTNVEMGNCPCSYNFGLKWAKSMEKMNDSLIFNIFIEQIKGNGWSVHDDVIAQGDYGDKFKWSDYMPK
jgi:hypothetical protein